MTTTFRGAASILDGRKIRDEILAELKPRVDALVARGHVPGLAVVLVGHDPASEIYVRNKVKACRELGIFSEQISPPETITTDELLAIVTELNNRKDIDGILVQMPLPKHVDTRRVLNAIRPDKDADGFHPINIGHLVSNVPAPRPCTPAGIMELLKRNGIRVEGKRAVVVGRSDIVGKPVALMLLHENATVTICHSRTPDLAAECRRADILVAAIGKPAMLTRDFIAPGAIVVDVGINRITDTEQQRAIFGSHTPRTVIGDVHPVDVTEVAGAYTPVPGGVGLLTVAMLMSNTVRAAEQRCSASG